MPDEPTSDHERFRSAIYGEEPLAGLAEHLATCEDCRRLSARLERITRDAREAPIPKPRPELLAEILACTSGFEGAPGQLYVSELRRHARGSGRINDPLPQMLPGELLAIADALEAAAAVTECEADGYRVQAPCGDCAPCRVRAALERLSNLR